ncbi:hypothetical protein ACFPRL_07635 [Pseudoclavibacter helvolus]
MQALKLPKGGRGLAHQHTGLLLVGRHVDDLRWPHDEPHTEPHRLRQEARRHARLRREGGTRQVHHPSSRPRVVRLRRRREHRGGAGELVGRWRRRHGDPGRRVR